MYWPMQRAIDRLIRLVARRRRVVLGLWIVLLVAALPFAAHQTEHLTAGGFEVPGSGSLAAADALSQFPSVHSQSLVIVFDNEQHNKSDLVAAIAPQPGVGRSRAFRLRRNRSRMQRRPSNRTPC
jgi:uncharacterized membrane protein YdfJ with MMPL/SSD domain